SGPRAPDRRPAGVPPLLAQHRAARDQRDHLLAGSVLMPERGAPSATERSAAGKISPEAFASLVAPYLGAARAGVRVGPRAGADCALVRVGAGRVLAITSDPLSLVPVLGPERSARLACHLLASDLWTSGIPPAWVSVTLNLPPHMSDATLAAYWRAMSDEWAK